MKCDGGPVFVSYWLGNVDEDVANKAIIDLTSRMMACWTKTLNMLLKARGLLIEGENYQLRHGHLQIGGQIIMSFTIEVIYERYEEGRQTKSIPCAHFDLIRKTWNKLSAGVLGGFWEPNSQSWGEAQKIFSEITEAVSWIDINR